MLLTNKTPLSANRPIVQSTARGALKCFLCATVLASPCHSRDEYSAALDRFITSEPATFLAQLDRQRPPVLAADLRAKVIAALPKKGEARITVSQQRKLDSLGPVLRAHGREGVYLVKAVDARQARVSLHAGFVLLITETALSVLSSAQLQAMVAHEIGHEYTWEEYEVAKKRGDWNRLRELELFCDGIAVVTLARIGSDPSDCIAALELMYSVDRAAGVQYEKSDQYPTLAERRRFMKEIRRWFMDGAATNASANH